MDMRKVLATAITGFALAVGGGSAMAQTQCTSLTTIGTWIGAGGGSGTCEHGDKTFTLNSTDLGAGVTVLFNPNFFAFQIIGFDTSAAAGDWNINYTVTVTDPTQWIVAMAAGADNPFGTSTLDKDVTGDPGGAFSLSVINGVEVPGVSSIAGLTAVSLTVDENFHVDADSVLLSVSNGFVQAAKVPEPNTLLLIAAGLAALGGLARRRRT